MAFYGESLYNESFYDASEYRLGTELGFTICTRIVKPFVPPPPVMDTLAYGLAQRFNWLQQGIQVFDLLNKIKYNKGQDLDDNWGKVYDLPRFAGESDDDYRARLITYTKVLTGSGTKANSEAVLDALFDLPGVSRIESRYPAHVVIVFDTIEGMRQAKQRSALLNSVLPGMFAAGITYEVSTPVQDFDVTATIRGEAMRELLLGAAIQSERGLSFGIDARVAYSRNLDMNILVAVQADRMFPFGIKTTLRGELMLPLSLDAAIRGEPALNLPLVSAVQAERERSISILSAIQSEPMLNLTQSAAIARTFETYYRICAYLMLLKSTDFQIAATVQTAREISLGLRTRIAKPGIP